MRGKKEKKEGRENKQLQLNEAKSRSLARSAEVEQAEVKDCLHLGDL